MGINKGWKGAVVIGTDTVAHINNWEISFGCDALENTAFGTTVHDRTFEPGLRSHTVTLSGYTMDSDPAQGALLDEMTGTSTPSAVTLKCITDTSDKGFTGDGIITGITVGQPVDGLSPFSATFQISGGLTTL